jgi:hypothetical protein
LEAFCIASILKNIKNKDLNIWADFTRSLQKLKKINFGVQEQERLLRAQGAMFMMMYNNTTLHQIIQKEYEKQQEYLPFILKK